MSGHRELLPTAHAARFDEDDVAADGRPNQADGDARLFDAFLDFPFDAKFRHAERFVHHIGRDHQLLRFAFRNAPRLFPDQCGDFAFEVADARFARVAVNHLAQAIRP